MNMNTYPTTERTVTVVVDVENDFCPGGTLAVTEGNEVVEPLNAVTEATRQQDGTVVHTKDAHPAETPHFDIWPVHCVEGTPGAEFHPDLVINPTDIIIKKGMGQENGYSGFEGRADNGLTLEQIIQPRTPSERVIVNLGGLATDYCVKATAINAAEQAKRVAEARQGIIEVYAMQDAMRAVNLQPTDEAEAIRAMQDAGVVMTTSQEVIARMEA